MNRSRFGKIGWYRILVLMGMLLLAACTGGHRTPPPPTPVITAQPADVSVVAGNDATFSVTATGESPSYQWQGSNDDGANWANLSGATATSYSLTAVSMGDSGRLFRVLITAAGATVASSPARLTVTAAPVAPAITVQPSSQTVTEPATATFSVTATGTSLQYQWQLSTDGGTNWTDISGATSAAYTTPATQAAASGVQFRVHISNNAGSVTSNVVTLTINVASSSNIAPSITMQPASQSVAAGSSAIFSASVSGTPTPTLQWQRSGNGGASWTDIAGATSDHYSTPATVAGDDAAQFHLIASNSEGSATSNAATLTVTAAANAPTFTTQPQDASVTAGNSASFSVAANGVPAPSFQWQLSTDDGANWSNITGATSASYNTPATMAGDNGKQYRAVASNSEAAVNSSAAVLTVTATLTATVWPVSAGGSHSCALVADQTVACWGRNASGQLGDGSTIDRLVPVAVASLTSVVSVAAGNSQSCALKTNGTVACWGSNLEGALGDGSTDDRSTPVTVSGLTNVVAIAVSSGGCALKTDGTVACWGRTAGQSNGSTGSSSTTPVAVAGLTDVVSVSTAPTHTCVLKTSGTVACWGNNTFGQLGTGGGTTSTPTTVYGLTNAVAVGTGYRHSCALKADGTVECWGSNNAGELGDGSATTSSPYSVTVSGLTNVIAVAVGYSHSCALKSDGSVACWGDNPTGQLGDGTTTTRRTPVVVSGLSNVVAIAAGYLHSCALKADGTIACWGYNGDGRVGDGSMSNRLTPVAVSGGAMFWK